MISRACDVCLKVRNEIKRYGLTRQERPDGGVNTTWGRGSIDLCDSCWERLAAHRMRPQRANRNRNT